MSFLQLDYHLDYGISVLLLLLMLYSFVISEFILKPGKQQTSNLPPPVHTRYLRSTSFASRALLRSLCLHLPSLLDFFIGVFKFQCGEVFSLGLFSCYPTILLLLFQLEVYGNYWKPPMLSSQQHHFIGEPYWSLHSLLFLLWLHECMFKTQLLTFNLNFDF
jgi:hypothetical protein